MVAVLVNHLDGLLGRGVIVEVGRGKVVDQLLLELELRVGTHVLLESWTTCIWVVWRVSHVLRPSSWVLCWSLLLALTSVLLLRYSVMTESLIDVALVVRVIDKEALWSRDIAIRIVTVCRSHKPLLILIFNHASVMISKYRVRVAEVLWVAQDLLLLLFRLHKVMSIKWRRLTKSILPDFFLICFFLAELTSKT
jgi:hypothetical protein